MSIEVHLERFDRPANITEGGYSLDGTLKATVLTTLPTAVVIECYEDHKRAAQRGELTGRAVGQALTRMLKNPPEELIRLVEETRQDVAAG